MEEEEVVVVVVVAVAAASVEAETTDKVVRPGAEAGTGIVAVAVGLETVVVGLEG
jgi:hypothetical protein